MQIQPYLFFEGKADEAIEFYKTAVGATVTMLMRYKDAPPAPAGGGDCGAQPPADKVMHANLMIGGATVLLSDGRCSGTPKFDGFGISLIVPTEADADRCFDGLIKGGDVTMPLAKTFFSKKFGMLRDKFGVHWMVMVQQ